MVDWPTHVGGRAAHPWARSGSTLASVDLVHWFLNSVIYTIEFHSVAVVCFPHTCFSIYLYAQHVETKHISKIEIESR